MILERLAVRAFGCLRDPVELTFDERFNLVAGRNEAGKSTLFRALHHALFTPYSSSAQEIRDLQPWGTELSPEVTVEFRVGEERFRLVKSFLSHPRCLLAEWDGGRFRDRFEADGADERVRSFLLGERPGSGAAQEKHRGLARLLWIPQGHTALPELEGDVRQRIEQSLDAMTLDEGEGRLLASISGRYADIWAKNGKTFVKKSGLPALEDELNALKLRLEGLKAALRDAEQTGRRLQDVEVELGGLGDAKKAALKELEDVQADVKRVQTLKLRLERERSELAKRNTRWERLKKDRERLETLKREARDAEEAIQSNIDPRLERISRDLEEARRLRDEYRRRLGEAEERVKATRSEWRRARRLREAKDHTAEIHKLTQIVRDVEAIHDNRETLNERLLQMPNPSEADIRNARALESQIQRLEGRLHSAGIRVAFQAERELTGSIRSDGETERTFSLEAADRVDFAAARKMEWRIDGVGRFVVESGAEEIVTLEKEKEKAAEQLKELLNRFGARSSDQVAEQRQERREVEQAILGLENRAKQLMQEHASLEDLKRSLAELERRLAASCEDLGVERSGLEAIEIPDTAAAEEAYTRAESAHASLRRDLDEVVAEADKLQEQVNALNQQKAVETEKRRTAERGIEALLYEYGSEGALADACQTAEQLVGECEERVHRLVVELPAEDDDPEREASRLEARLANLNEEFIELLQTKARLEQQLESVAEKGTYEEYAQVEERLRLTQDQYERQIRQAKAVKLLKALSDARQERVFDQLTGPISRRVTRYFEQVSGEVGRRIHFDRSLRPAGMDVDRTEGLATEALSTGAREQLHILSRLALGRYLASRNGRMLFVLDDSLVNTDALRRRRLLDLLVEAQDELQVVLLTCHPEWYRELEGAKTLRLPETHDAPQAERTV